MSTNLRWRVRFDSAVWAADLRAAGDSARDHANRWRLRIELGDGLPHGELKATPAEDSAGGLELSGCVKTYIPDPDHASNSPWGAVLLLARDSDGLYLALLAFGVRHPQPPSNTPSVYQRAHRRLNPK